MFETNNLSVRVGNTTLLNNVTVHFHSNQLSAILGANGAGKSTLLKVLSGDIAPSSGTVSLCGQKLHEWPADELATTRAIMAQQRRPQFAFTVLEYLMLARHAWVESKQQSIEFTDTIVQRLELQPFLQRPITQLSGGEWQRVQFARSWLQVLSHEGVKNKVLLLDEPIAALDIYQQGRFFSLLKEFMTEGGTVLIVLHDINQAARIADAMLLLNQGHVVASGRTQDVFSESHLNRCFNVSGSVQHHGDNHAYFHYL